MKHIKFQSDLLKECEKRDGWKHARFPFLYCQNDESVIVCNSHFAIIIPKEVFYLDIETTFNSIPSEGLKKLLQEGTHDARHTGVQKIIDNKLTVTFFECNGEEIPVDINLLKYFDLSVSTFKADNKKSPVQIYENDVLVGLVLPVNLR